MIERDSKVHADLGDYAKYAVKGERTITFQLDSGGLFDAHDVLYVPGLKNNFISVLAMEDKCFFVTFQRGKVLIHLEKYIPYITVVVGVREGTLYRLHGNIVQYLIHNSDNLCELWNRRLGHLHYRELPIPRGIVIGIP